MNDMFTDLYNRSDVKAYENKLANLKEGWLEIETERCFEKPWPT